MQCYVYRSKQKLNTYLFLTEQDDFSSVPDSLLKLFGTAEFSFAFELTPNRKLALADPVEVLKNITANGYFLQLPPGDKDRFSVH